MTLTMTPPTTRERNGARVEYVGGDGRRSAEVWKVLDNPHDLDADDLSCVCENGPMGFGCELFERDGELYVRYWND